jgi:CheY-like chemotaxis protein
MKDQHKLRVHLSLSGNIEPGTDSMKVMIYQCVQELLFNTVKYARVSECFLRLIRLEDHALQITVEDEGVGFDAAQVVHKDVGGFGLFSIRERMKALGGELQISSVPGQGSIFIIIIPDSNIEPVLESAGGHEEKTIGPRSQEDGIVVLVADDHPIIRQSLASLLIAQPFIKEVIQAANGQEAVRQAEANDPDIILMDINMPIMNGIEATQLLGHKNLRSKVIGLSVQSENEMAHAMKDLGAVDYFNKGDDTSMLINSIKKFAYTDQ